MGAAVQDLRKRFDPKIEEIRESVSKNIGEIVLCLRELILKPREYRGCFPVGTPNFYYLESGIISGELKELDDDFIHKTIDVFDLSRHPRSDYFIIVNYGIPVKQLFSNSGSFFINLGFRPERLKEFKEGKIVFATYEFPEIRSLHTVLGDVDDHPSINSLDFLFGEKNVRDYLGSHKNVASRGIDDFVQLITVSGELEKRAGDYKKEERRNLADELIVSVSHLCELDRNVKRIEHDVLNASFTAGPGWESWSLYEKEVHQYDSYHTGLRNRINNTINLIKGKIRKSEDIGLRELTHISGGCLGFPGEATPSEYLDNYKKEILPKIIERLGKLDEYLDEQRRKAKK